MGASEAAPVVPFESGKSIDFVAASAQYLRGGNFNNITGDFTFDIWIKKDANNFTTVSKRNSGALTGYAFNIFTWFGLQIIGTGGYPADTLTLISSTNPAVGTWEHRVWTSNLTFAGTKHYKNGANESCSELTATTLSTSPSNTADLLIGADVSDSVTRYYDGNEGHIGFWNRILTPTEVAELYALEFGDRRTLSFYSAATLWVRMGNDPRDSTASGGKVYDTVADREFAATNMIAANIEDDAP